MMQENEQVAAYPKLMYGRVNIYDMIIFVPGRCDVSLANQDVRCVSEAVCKAHDTIIKSGRLKSQVTDVAFSNVSGQKKGMTC